MAYAPTTEWGTKKRIAKTQVYNANPGTGTITVTCSLPDGTKAATIDIEITTTTTIEAVGIQEYGSGVDRWRVRVGAAGETATKTGDIAVDASGRFDIVPTGANVTNATINVLEIYL